MYFQIENTPEHIRRARQSKAVKEQSFEEIPRLVIAPFSRPPKVVFENVLIGTSSERSLEVFNPSAQTQQITLDKALPPGLVIQLPGKWLQLEPETCYCLKLQWTPIQPTAMRETIRFTNDSRGRFDVIVVLKSALHIKGKSNQPKFKTSPGKAKKKANKTSPGAIYKKKSQIIYNTTKVKRMDVVKTTIQHKVYNSNKENVSLYNNSVDSRCPFGSLNSIDFNFNTSEVFPNMKSVKDEFTQETFNKNNTTSNVYENALKPSNKQTMSMDMFDNLTFTPLKNVVATSDRLEKGPKIVISANSESDFDDSIDMQSGKENATHSIVCIASSRVEQTWHSQHVQQLQTDKLSETATVLAKKVPNTSSPKDLNSPNFSINTDFSRISDLSFQPQRFSTEKKVLPTMNNNDILDDHNSRLNSDTFTKDSSQNIYQSLDYHINQGYMDGRPMSHYQPTKVCRQSLFKEFQVQRDAFEKQHHYHYPKHPGYESVVWPGERSPPPRSLSPPLQSIPEENTHFSDTQILDRTDKQSTFTINRTFDKFDRHSVGPSRHSWSKKAVRAEHDLWKVPVAAAKKSTKTKNKDSLGGKASNVTFDGSKIIQNITLNQIGNVFSQSLTVDPFLSSTYFYDEEAVDKFETEFKKWLNYILTPPADLDSNIEMKIDVGKAWLENRNKEIPLAPTKEQVSSQYHNSHRLESLRRAARALLMSPEIAQVFQKLSAQIEKKLIAIRTDRNLHLDVGLQKAIMELLLSYNPLWLRIGLEVIYGLVIPLKSNSDIDGLTTFIIQRMFKNPHLKNKHSKSNAPNMLLPAYMEAIKKFTLKKFFMLVFFLDQAKQRKIISHDPCLFCRNAVCKESREILIRFTRELIAGIGDITKHLRPLGYVVSHKQSYLDEYKYAVHNIAIDIRDGVRITKVMEIILMKNNLMKQMRTPAISRLQKIHNVSVALNALKEANFVIVGDITPNDIADGHREKTLSLLWQIIHVFRAPLFDKAANVIQVWWRMKYQVIAAKRREEQRIFEERQRSASLIQWWWRKIQYNKYLEAKMKEVTRATIVVQRYWRMWLCRSRLRKLKASVQKIENWYRSIKLRRDAKDILHRLRLERQELLRRSATKIQVYIRRWLCMRKYEATIKKIILVQSLMRCFVLRQQYLRLNKAVKRIQQRYRAKLQMKEEMKKFAVLKESAIKIQSYYRMVVQLRQFNKLKHSVKTIEEKYKAIVLMRVERKRFLMTKQAIICIQSHIRGRNCRKEYNKQIKSIIKLQRRVRANQLMNKERDSYMKTVQSVLILQRQFKAYLAMKRERDNYNLFKTSAVAIQKYFRCYKLMKTQRKCYLDMRNAAVTLQRRYRAQLAMRHHKAEYLRLKHAAIVLQKKYRAHRSMLKSMRAYKNLRAACVVVQRRYRAQILKRRIRAKYLALKSASTLIQRSFKAYLEGKRQRLKFLKMKNAAIDIQRWYRSCKKTIKVKQQYLHAKRAIVTIQRTFRAFVLGKKQRQEYLRVKTATICIQKRYRLYTKMRVIQREFHQLKSATVTIQRRYRAIVEGRKQKEQYMLIRRATVTIQKYYKLYKQTKRVREQYVELRQKTIYIQRTYRSVLAMREVRARYIKLKESAICIQNKYRALTAMKKQRDQYQRILSAVVTIQSRFRAQKAMEQKRLHYKKLVTSAKKVQLHFRAKLLGRKERARYMELKQATLTLQARYRAKLSMKKAMIDYQKIRSAVKCIQIRFRAHLKMREQRRKYVEIQRSCFTIQRNYRAYLEGKKQRAKYCQLKSAVILIQQRYRLIKETRLIRKRYLEIRRTVIFLQRQYRANRLVREIRRNAAAKKIQEYFKAVQLRNKCRTNFMKLRKCAVLIQSTYRAFVARKLYLKTKRAAVTIQTYYKAYRLCVTERTNYVTLRTSVIKIQASVRCYIQRKKYLKLRTSVINIQNAYRLRKQRKIEKQRREMAALCIQTYYRRYLAQSRYKNYRNMVVTIQRVWKNKLVTRFYRYEFMQTRSMVIRLQAVIRGFLVRKRMKIEKEKLAKAREEKRIHNAASKIQALFRGHHVRTKLVNDRRVANLRRRWREGALHSTQDTLEERHAEAMEVLSNSYDIETVIRAFRSLELSTGVFPMMYSGTAATVARCVYIYMAVTNRSISSIEVLKSAAAVLTNLARFRLTGPSIYNRERISPVLKFMCRFSKSETQLFCIFATYLWLFHKYDQPREDMIEFLNIPENHKMMVMIKGNVDRTRRMAENVARRHRASTIPKLPSMNASICGGILPALEPNYGITRAGKPQYFEDASQAINCLFRTFNLH